jgi:cellulose synthase/poly-beta-1,6-N-acetylglucosamine synthase-like glycosyltransferase
MSLIIEICFWTGLILMAHSYVLYPLLLKLLAKQQSLPRQHVWQPDVHVLMAVRNGEKIIRQKIESVIKSNYPNARIHLWVGSDQSTDHTDSIIESYVKQHPNFHFTRFNQRMGKIRIINALYDMAAASPNFEQSIIISTDVTAIFDENCITSLVSVFVGDQIGIVGSNIFKSRIGNEGIAVQEQAYYARELNMKYHEGILWGATMGVFGACFAIRSKIFSKVPEHFVADDFFITLSALQQRYKVLLDDEAKVYMNLPSSPQIEYRRKVRIATGNFQNLFHFLSLLVFPPSVAYVYWSHKVIRWLGPFFILGCFIASWLLQNKNIVYEAAWFTQIAIFSLIPIGWALNKLGIQNKVIRFITHFYHMNLGMLIGLVKYLRGVKTSVWEPTQR